MDPVYLDHNATAPLRPSVGEAMAPFNQAAFGNPSSIHRFGQEARRGIDRARRQLSQCLGAKDPEIVFTSSGTESDNLALFGTLQARRAEGRDHLVVSAIEHPAVLEAARALLRLGFRVDTLPVSPDGRVQPTDLEALVDNRTALVSVMLANNELGTLQPLEALCEVAHGVDAWIHTDAVQALGRVPLDVRALGVDLLSVSSHKIGGPKGAGALFIRRGHPLAPQLHGGSQEFSLRAGTENVPAIVGFGAAAASLDEMLGGMDRLLGLRNELESWITGSHEMARVNGANAPRLPNTSSVTLDRIDARSLVMSLDVQGIAISTGSACASGKVDPSHVLLALGHTEEAARQTVRFSFGPTNRRSELERVYRALDVAIERLQHEQARPKRAMGR